MVGPASVLHNYYVRDRRSSIRRDWFGRPRKLSSSHLHDAGLGIVWTNSQDVRPGEPHQVSVPALQLVTIVEPGVHRCDASRPPPSGSASLPYRTHEHGCKAHRASNRRHPVTHSERTNAPAKRSRTSCPADNAPFVHPNYAQRSTVCVILCISAGLIEEKQLNYAQRHAMCVVLAPGGMRGGRFSCITLIRSTCDKTSGPIS